MEAVNILYKVNSSEVRNYRNLLQLLTVYRLVRIYLVSMAATVHAAKQIIRARALVQT